MKDIKNIQELFNAFSTLKVLIIGDVMVDSYIRGRVERISPEAPVPVVHVKDRESRLGGAANVALNIQALGATPILCSIIGDDIHAQTFKTLLKARGMTDKGIITSSKRTTTVKHRVISSGHHLLRIDEEIDEPLSEIDRKSLINHIIDLMDSCDVIIFEDYDKGCIDAEVIQKTVSHAKAIHKPVAVDPKKRNFHSYHGVTLFKPNLKELREGLNLPINPEAEGDIRNALKLLKKKIDFQSALITLSEHGMYYQSTDTEVKVSAHVRSISDVSGAGDTVISIASLCLALGVHPVLLTELSNLGGGIVCEYPGVVPIDKDRLIREASNTSEIAAIFGSTV